MKEGLLWFDNDPQRKLTDKIERAARHFQAKFGQKPTACYVNTADLPNPVDEWSGIRLMAARNVQRYHLWIGIEETGATKAA